VFQQKFPEIFNHNDANAIVEAAAQKAAIENEFSEKAKYPDSYCWAAWAAQMLLCDIACSNQGNSCWFACYAVASAGAGVCFLFAD
jgi:hypothetical protein